MKTCIKQSALLTAHCSRFGRIEFALDLTSCSENPYRSAEIALDAIVTLPSGRVMTVPGFYFVDQHLQSSALAPVAGSGQWRVRLSSSECGEHRSRFVLKVRGEIASEVDGPDFVVADSELQGKVRVSAFSSHYLELENGQPYFAIGQNLCFLSERAGRIPIYPDCGVYSPLDVPDLPWDEAYRRWMTRMAEQGANWMRVWMRPTFYLEQGELWEFSQENAWRLDWLLDLAESLGMYVCLCMDDIRDFFRKIEGISTPNWFSGYETAWRRLLESSDCHQNDSFFSEAAALEMMRDKLRYIIARWGYSSHMFAWELWNEIQCVWADPGLVSSWVKAMTSFIRETDPHGHLIKSSYYGVGPEDLSLAHGDINDAHPYFGWHGTEETKDFANVIYHFVMPIRGLPQPFMLGEGGLAREVQTIYGLTAELADRDSTCLHVHEALWGGLFSGSCGTCMVWWWDAHVDRHDAYWRFRGIANFVKDVPFNRERFALRIPSISSPALRTRELQSQSLRLVWVQHLWFTWWNAINGRVAPDVSDAILSLDGMMPGRYLVQFWDTVEGRIFSSTTSTATSSTLLVPLPVVRGDLAIKIIAEQ